MPIKSKVFTRRKRINVRSGRPFLILSFLFVLLFQIILAPLFITNAAPLLSDDFTGTTIDTVKWIEIDTAGIGGTTGNIQQNGSLSVRNSDNGTSALVSVDSFTSDGLEISSTITTSGGKFILGYGDHEWAIAGHRAYLLYYSGSGILGLAWNNKVLNKNVPCGTMTSGANYKMKIISTGFEVYKNDVLQCTVTPTVQNLVDGYPVFLESNETTTSFFDDLLVVGISPEEMSEPVAPTIGTATAGNTEASVSFTPSSNGGSPITGYTVTSNPGSITGVGTSSPITVTGLTNGTPYTFTVTATNAIGTSLPSTPSNAVTPGEINIFDSVSLWLKADDITGLNDGDSLTTWEDSSINDLDATQSTVDKKPIYKTNMINSQPAVRFDGVNDLLVTPSTSAAAGVTIFSVVKSADTSGGYLLWLGGNNNSIIHGYTGAIWEYYATPRTNLGNISTSEFQIITSRVGSSLTNSISLGADAGTIAPWAGDVAELLVFKFVLSDTDYNTVYNYLNDKYFVIVDPIAPDAPSGLEATPSSEQMLLSWTAPVSNGGAEITDYLIEYKLSSEPTTWTTFADGTSTNTTATVTGLTNNLSYDFRVSATNSVGTGGASNIATIIVQYVLFSDMFTGTTIDTNKWIEIDTGGLGGIIGNVQQNGSLTVANSESGTNEGLNALVSVDSFDADGLEISAKLTGTANLLFGYGDRQWNLVGNRAYMIYLSTNTIMGLTWHDGSMANSNTNCGIAVSGAIYRMKIIPTGFEVYKNDVLQCTVTPGAGNLVNNKPIFLEGNSSSVSTFDDVLVTGTYTPPSAPNAPTIGTAIADNAQATVTFVPGPSNGSPITGYTVTSNPGSITANGSGSPIIVTGLTNDVEYTFTVTATNAIGTSVSSSPSNAVTPRVPDVPDQVTNLTSYGYNKQTLLGWTVPNNGGAPISDYLIEYKVSSSSTWSVYNHSAITTSKAIVRGLSNGIEYNFRVSAINSGGPGIASEITTATPRAIEELVFVINGESNAGGQANNSEATVEELASTSEVQILNNTTFLFENLDIGTNNNIDHCCWLYSATDHGFELGLANSVKANTLPDNPQVHLIKTGQGGSRLSQWNVGGTYWNKFLERVNAAKTQVSENKQWVTWISIGINDYLAGTTVSTFKTQLIDHIKRIEAELPGSIIILTQFQSMGNGGYATYNTAMGEIAETKTNVFVVDSTGADMDDGNHWSYDGLKTVGDRMITITKNILGLNYPGKITSPVATPSGTSVNLSWTAPISNGGSVITDYLIEYKSSSSSTWSTFSDGISTNLSSTVTGLSGSTEYDFRVSGVNANGTGNPVSVTTTTTDGSAPIISSILSTSTNTSSTLTWTTNEESSSIVDYGLTNSYGNSTTEPTTPTRVTSHLITLSDLVSCTTYYYRVRSTDFAHNEAISFGGTFTTLGCTGSATVDALNTGTITSALGGSIDLLSDSKGISLAVPASFSELDANFQIKQLNKTSVLSTTSIPTGFSVIGSYIYDLKALTDISTFLSSFNNAVTVSFTYGSSDISGINVDSLGIYRWDGSNWNQLTSCSENTTTKTISCTTTAFSVFGLFGKASSTTTILVDSSNNNSSSINPSSNQTPLTTGSWSNEITTETNNLDLPQSESELIETPKNNTEKSKNSLGTIKSDSLSDENKDKEIYWIIGIVAIGLFGLILLLRKRKN